MHHRTLVSCCWLQLTSHVFQGCVWTRHVFCLRLFRLQLTTYQERLRFAEQEAQQAQSNAAEKSKMAREVSLTA